MLERIFIIITLLLVGVSSFANVLIVSESPLGGKVALSPDDLDFINGIVTYSLNDLSDVLPYNYIDVRGVESWYNSLVDIINETNTNVITIGKKQVKPKPLPKLTIKTLNTTTLANIVKLIPEVKGAILVSYTAKGSDITINIQNLGPDGKVIGKKSILIPVQKLVNKDWVILTVKEGIVDLLGAWKFYYYDPKTTGTVSISIKPSVKNVSVLVKPDDTPLKVGNNTLNEGEYTLFITAPGYKDIVTNIYVPPMGNLKLSFNLEVASKVDTPIPMGSVYIDANVRGIPLIIAEGNVVGTTPLYTNLTEGIKNIIFQQTSTTLLKSAQIEVKPNRLNYYYITLDRVGAGVTITADNGSFVVIDRKLEGSITAGSYSKMLSKGIHTITVFKNGFETFRTNVNITGDEKINLKVSFVPKKVSVFVVTPQSKEAIIRYQGRDVATVPNSVKVEEGKESNIEIIAQEVGYNNTSVSFVPSFRKVNSVVKNLSPLYGDLLIITDPIDAIVKVDGKIVGKTGIDGLLLRSIPARKSFIFVQKEGYKAVKTNIYIMPNIQNSLAFKLKEAPVKLFVNTTPVSGVSVYMNDEYYGENDGIINVELGNFVMKLIKRNFKTVYTNVSFPEKVDTIIPLTFQIVPGSSEVEIVEILNSNLIQVDNLISNGNYLDAYNLLGSTIKLVVDSGYTNYSKEIYKLFEFLVKKQKDISPKVEFYSLNKEADDTISKVYQLQITGLYKDGLKLLRDFISKVNSSSVEESEKLQILGKVKDKYKELALLDISTSVSNLVLQGNKLLAKGERSAAVGFYEDAVKTIDEYLVDVPEIESEVSDLRNTVLSNYITFGVEVISNKVEKVFVDVENLEKNNNLTNAIDLVNNTIKEIRLSKLYYLDTLKQLEERLKEKYDYLVSKSIEAEQMGEVKAIYDEIKPILKEAVRLSSIKEYDNAINKYREALKIIEISEFKENPFLSKLKDGIIADISKIEEEKKKEEEIKAKKISLQQEIEKKKKELPWWVRMTKAWTGVGFEIGSSMLIPNGMQEFVVDNMNIPVYAKLHISFLPIIGLNFGGLYNVNSQQVSTNAAYLNWLGFGQLELRIPIIKQLSIFGDFGTGIGQLITDMRKFRLGEDFLLSTGIDLKFSWFGIRLGYDMAFYDNFTKNQIGGSFAIILWATED